MIDPARARFARASVLGLAVAAAGACGPTPPTSSLEEHMPAPASIWLTTVPESPKQDVEVSLVIEDEVNRSRTFPAGTPVRASFPVSDRTPYRLVAWDGACSVDFDVAAEQEADVVLTLAGDRTCELDVINLHGFDRAPHGPPTVTVEP